MADVKMAAAISSQYLSCEVVHDDCFDFTVGVIDVNRSVCGIGTQRCRTISVLGNAGGVVGGSASFQVGEASGVIAGYEVGIGVLIKVCDGGSHSSPIFEGNSAMLAGLVFIVPHYTG